MTITREELDSIFKECNKFFNMIEKLQEETRKLKEQRPALLADGKSVGKINKRLKKIEEEI